jgi:hypothetical protein
MNRSNPLTAPLSGLLFFLISVYLCSSVDSNGFSLRGNELSGWLLFGELFLLFIRWRLGFGYNEMYFRN